MHVTKNDSMPVKKALLIRVLTIVAALVFVGLISMILIQKNPFLIYEAMLYGAFLDVWTFLRDVALLLMFGLAVIPAFKMKYWNLGANGQVLIGCFAAIACMQFIPRSNPNIPDWLLMVIMVAASLTASILWAIIPAIFKAFFNTNETLFTLMMNYIALTGIDYLVFKLWLTDDTGKAKTTSLGAVNGPTADAAYKFKGWFPDISGNQYLLPILVALILTIIMFVYLKYTKHGFEISLVGESVNTAKYVGINVKKVVIRTLLFSGVICGIIGVLYAGSISHTINKDVGGLGFTAILVAWLAGFDPAVMVVTSFFVIMLDTGSKYVSTYFQLGSNDYASIVVGIIFFFVIGCEFFIRYKIQFKKKETTAERSAG